jgi:ankyrin repeat protein
VNVEDYAGWTPLSEAVVHQKADCVRFLLSKGANVNTQSNDNAMLFDENQEPCVSYFIAENFLGLIVVIGKFYIT